MGVDINIICHLISAGKRGAGNWCVRNSLVFNKYFYASSYGISDH
jgi:hypothetical protein